MGGHQGHSSSPFSQVFSLCHAHSICSVLQIKNCGLPIHTNSLACYCHSVKSKGRRAKNTSLTYLLTSSAVTDEDHMCQTCRGGPGGGQNRDIHLTFPGPRLQRAYQVPPRDVTTRRYVTITKPRSALLRSAMKYKLL